MGGFNRAIVATNEGDRRGARPGDGWLSNVTISAVSADTNQTITVAQMLGGVITSAGKTAGRTFTTDTAANLLLGLPNMDVGESLMFQLASIDGFTTTVAGGTGVTASGNLLVLTLTAKEFILTRTGAATFNLVGL